MTALERWSLQWAVLATALTGLGYGWVRYFGMRQGEFGPEPHALQGLLQHAHVLAGPLLVFTLGIAFKGHVGPALASGYARARRSGLGLALLAAPLILSGYAVQIAVDPSWRLALAWLHGLVALVFLLGFLAHLVVGAKGRRAGNASEGEVTRPFA